MKLSLLNILEIGTPNQYKSPEAQARQSQELERERLEKNSLKKELSSIKFKMQMIIEELKQLEKRKNQIESLLYEETPIDDFDF